jgi:DNA-binding MarR family transcriptional regulator
MVASEPVREGLPANIVSLYNYIRMTDAPVVDAGLDPVVVANGLRPVVLHINRHLRRELHALGIGGSQVSLLASIQGSPGIGVGELAAREGTSAPSISNHIDRLEASGLVTRSRVDGGDRRRIGLAVTSEGARVLRTVRSRRTAWLAARLRELPEEQLRAIDAALVGLRALVERPAP